MIDLPLFAQAHSPTSQAAAESIAPGIGERRTLERLRDLGEYGSTDSELQEHFGWDGSYQRPRRINLVHRGLVKDSGCTRSTKSGRAAVVWQSTGATA